MSDEVALRSLRSLRTLRMREGLDFVVEDVEGGGCHGSVVEAVDFVELDGGVSAEAEHTPKVGVFFISAEQLDVASSGDENHGHGRAARVVERGIAVDGGLKVADAVHVAVGEVGNGLSGEWDYGQERVGVDAVWREPRFVEGEHHGEVSSGRMAGEDNLGGVAAEARCIVACPGHGGGRVGDARVDGHCGHEAVVGRHHNVAFAEQFGRQGLGAGGEASAVEPYYNRGARGRVGTRHVDAAAGGGVCVGGSGAVLDIFFYDVGGRSRYGG